MQVDARDYEEHNAMCDFGFDYWYCLLASVILDVGIVEHKIAKDLTGKPRNLAVRFEMWLMMSVVLFTQRDVKKFSDCDAVFCN